MLCTLMNKLGSIADKAITEEVFLSKISQPSRNELKEIAIMFLGRKVVNSMSHEEILEWYKQKKNL